MSWLAEWTLRHSRKEERRTEAAMTLSRSRTPRANGALISLVQTKREFYRVRVTAADALGKSGAREAIPVLTQALVDRSLPSLRAAAARSLKVLGWAPTTAGERAWLAVGLGDFHDTSLNDDASIEALACALDPAEFIPFATSGIPTRCAQAAAALAIHRSTAAIEQLGAVLGAKPQGRDQHAQHIRRAYLVTLIEALGATKDARCVRALEHALKNDDSDVREAVAGALTKIGGPNASRVLRQMLHDRTWPVQMKAADGLGELRDVSAVPALAASPGHNTISALAKIGGVDAQEALAQIMASNPGGFGKSAATALGKMGPSSLPALVHALERDDDVSHEAGYALTHIGAAAVPALIASLEKGTALAALALGRIKDRRSVGPLIAALGGEASSVAKRWSAEALGAMGAAESTSALCELARDKECADVALKELEKFLKNAVTAIPTDGLRAVTSLRGIVQNETRDMSFGDYDGPVYTVEVNADCAAMIDLANNELRRRGDAK